MNVTDMKTKRAGIWAQMQEIRTQVESDGESGGWTVERRAAWDAADKDLETLTGDIAREERDGTLNTRFGEIDALQRDKDVVGGNRGGDPKNEKETSYREVFNTFLRRGAGRMADEQRTILEQGMVELDERAMSTVEGITGGYTVPETFWAKVTETLKFFANVSEFADVVTTETGAKLPWATNDDTGNEGALLSELPTSHPEQDLAIGRVMLDAHIFTSRMVKISRLLIQDSAIDVEALVARKLGERLGRATNRFWTAGTGTDQPQGYMTGATVGKTTASATAFTWEEIVDLIHSVDAAYRINGRFGLHDLVLAEVRKMKDGEGRPLWQPSVAAGVPDLILGHPYFVNNHQADAVVANAKTIAFGDFRSGFAIRNVKGAEVARLGERFAEVLQVGFFSFLRTDSVVQDASAIKVLKQHA